MDQRREEIQGCSRLPPQKESSFLEKIKKEFLPMSLVLKYPFEYISYTSMKSRCYYPRSVGYKWYGAMGVTVCDRWRTSFANFIQDMGPRPTRKHSIDRIDPCGNYEPSNCRWATSEVQASNKRRRPPPHVQLLAKHQAACPHLRKVGLDAGWYCLDCAKMESR